MDYKTRLNKFIETACYNYDLPGLAASAWIGEKNKLGRPDFQYVGTAGYQDITDKTPLKKEHAFHMASVTKLVVSTSLLMLKEAGKLDLDRSIQSYLPDFCLEDQRFSPISIRALLTHTAGLGNVDDYEWDHPQIDEKALVRYIHSQEVREKPLLWAPTEKKFQYSDIGFEILGAVIAQISGESFENFVEKNIFRPLGMNESTLLTFRRTEVGKNLDENSADRQAIAAALNLESLKNNGVCKPHKKDENNRIIEEKYFPYNRSHGPSSTLCANLKEMKKWGDAHLNRSLLSEKAYEEAWKPYAVVPNNGENIGLGWFIREQNGYVLYGHEGTDDGFRSSFWICPELDLGIVVMANISRAPVKKINKQIFDILFEEKA